MNGILESHIRTLQPVAFNIFSIPVHWYGLMYVLALLSARMIAKWIVEKDNIDIRQKSIP
ncbi:MAG: prolipoprotein diacylglyceryl transferase family protein [Sulfurimonas sp.]